MRRFQKRLIDREKLRSVFIDRIKGPGADQTFDGFLLILLMSRELIKSFEIPGRIVFLPRSYDLIDDGVSYILYSHHSETDGSVVN